MYNVLDDGFYDVWQDKGAVNRKVVPTIVPLLHTLERLSARI